MSTKAGETTKSTERLIEPDVEATGLARGAAGAHRNDALESESSGNEARAEQKAAVQVVVVDRIDIHQANETLPIPAVRKSLSSEAHEHPPKPKKRERKSRIELASKVPLLKARHKAKEVEETIFTIEREQPERVGSERNGKEKKQTATKPRKKKKEKTSTAVVAKHHEQPMESDRFHLSIEILQTSELCFDARLKTPRVDVIVFDARTERVLPRGGEASGEQQEKLSSASGVLKEAR